MAQKDNLKRKSTLLFALLIIFPFLLTIFSFTYSFGLFHNDNYKSDTVQTDSPIEFENAEKVVLRRPDLQITYKDGSEKTYKVAKDFRLAEFGLDMSKVEVRIENESSQGRTTGIFLSFVPVLIIVLPLIFMLIMLYHALIVYGKNKIMWMLLILIIFPVGAIVYFFLVYRNAEVLKK